MQRILLPAARPLDSFSHCFVLKRLVSLDKHTQIIEYSLYGAACFELLLYALVPVGNSAGGQQKSEVARTLDKLLQYIHFVSLIFAG